MTDLSEAELARLARGRKAMDVLSSEAIADALDYLADQAVADWRKSPAMNEDLREVAYRQVATIDALRAQLSAWAEDAKGLAVKQDKLREREEAKAARPRRFGL